MTGADGGRPHRGRDRLRRCGRHRRRPDHLRRARRPRRRRRHGRHGAGHHRRPRRARGARSRSSLAQLDAVLDDLPVAAVKTGMLGTPDVVAAGRRAPARPQLPLVVDPVLVATSGAVLGDAQVARAYVEHLLPVATVITPNADEARALLGAHRTSRPDWPRELARLGPAVVLTGGGRPAPAPTGSPSRARPGRARRTRPSRPPMTTAPAARSARPLAVQLAHDVPLDRGGAKGRRVHRRPAPAEPVLEPRPRPRPDRPHPEENA